jgi:hypothetical protein
LTLPSSAFSALLLWFHHSCTDIVSCLMEE